MGRLPQFYAMRHRLVLIGFVAVFLASSAISVFGPWVIEASAAQKLPLRLPEPLNTEEQTYAPPKTDGLTEAAKATAVPEKDPVTAYQEEQAQQKEKPKPARIIKENEIKEKRTAFSNTYLNTEGGETERMYTEPVNYRTDKGKGTWTPIVGEIKEDAEYNKGESSKESLASRMLPGRPFVKKGLRIDTGLVRGTFRSLAESDGITINADGTSSFKVAPLGANPEVNPELEVYEDGQQYVIYKDAWKNADVYYEQRATSLKETIVLKSKDVPTTFGFRFSDAKLSFGVDKDGEQDGTIIAQLKDGTKVVLPQLTILSKVNGPFDSPNMHYELDGNVVRVVIDTKWFDTLSDSDFPVIVDPTYDWRGVSTGIPGGDYGQFIAYDSRGYACNSNICDVYAGALNSGGWKNWRTMMRLPLTSVYGQSVSWANIYTERVNRPNVWNGFNGNRPYEITWANCFGYHCFSGAPRASTWLDWAGNFDATGLMQWVSTNNIGDGWLMIKAVNEGDINSFKSFAGSRTFLDVNFRHWNQQSALPTLNTPAQNAVVPVSRPTLKINPVTDPDGDLIRYAFHLLDNKGKVIAHSGELDSSWWTIPDDILIDGETYSWRAFVLERNASNPSIVESGWRQQPEVRSFRFDLRTGKDKTQSYDEVGPLSVSLNQGKGYTGTSTHSTNALGGSIGVGLDYNTPGLSRYGLTGYYYNETGSGSRHAITVKDPNVDMAWGSGSPYPGTMQSDNFTINWLGYFIAPQDGSYAFGAGRDDRMSMTLNHSGTADLQFDFGCCGWNMANKSVTLKRGQAYPVSIWYFEQGGYAAAHLKVRLPDGAETIVPSEWLRTLPDSAGTASRGLVAKFYQTDSGNPNFVINENTPLVFSTRVPEVNSDWSTRSLLPYDVGSVYSDYMIVNYSGFITVPTDGKYQIGGGSDDGMRIRLGGKEVLNAWVLRGYTEGWSQELDLKAGQILPISVDFFEKDGAARVTLQWRSSTNAVNTGIIPGQYLSATPKVVPQGWAMSVDPDGDIPYELLQIKPSGNADLIDSDGFVHTYTSTGAGFKPPVNEDGYLVRNTDGTFTLTDVDGRVYNFSVDGLITQVSSPLDDRKPAALQYEYRDTSTSAYGSLPKLSKIKDGADPTNRYGQLYYWGEQGASEVCSTLQGFDIPPSGYLCGLKTFPDNQITLLAYKGDQLARVQLPGQQAIDYAYEANGRLRQVRDALANDAVAAGVRTADGTETTQISYDALGRISKVVAPAPFGATVPAGQSNARAEHIFEYGFQDAKTQLTGASNPTGYQQYIEYDNLYRTTRACDKAGLCTVSSYDPAK
ncbi:MAG TPA: PA14 domain-containing protein, partial [Candidatus Saccharimonadales bacterium]|nr:PA14 domain-containing protein [Candidatus Saccharimonadales bacterium]